MSANLNLYQIGADCVSVDLLTESGTGAVGGNQLAAMMMRGDDSYTGSASYRHFASAIREVFAEVFARQQRQEA